MDIAACWKSRPAEWQPLFHQWHTAYPHSVWLHKWPQYGGQEVVGITVAWNCNGNTSAAAARPFRLLAAVPHAHEPASTAAMVDVAAQLLTGRHLDGSSALLPQRQLLLEKACLTFLPDTNSQGRARSPVRCWDGTTYDHDSFLKWAFGIAKNGERFGRYPQWRISEHQPQRIGIEYEQYDDDLVVEPNTSRLATHTRAIDELYGIFAYTHMLDMHQHRDAEAVNLPAYYDLYPEPDRRKIDSWGARVIAAWQQAGATPRPVPWMPYAGGERQQFFLDYWQGRCPGMLRITVENRNNRTPAGACTPMEYQMRMAMTALTATLQLVEEVQ